MFHSPLTAIASDKGKGSKNIHVVYASPRRIDAYREDGHFADGSVPVGLTEGDARRQGVTVRVAKMPTSAMTRTQTADEKQGFMKTLVGWSDDRILGFTMIGGRSG